MCEKQGAKAKQDPQVNGAVHGQSECSLENPHRREQVPENWLEVHQEELRRFVNRAVSKSEDAADLLQQTLFQAHRCLPGFRGENLRAWLFTIARHLIVDYYRTRQRFTFVDVTQTGLADAEPALQMSSEAVRATFESRERLQHCSRCVTRRVPLNGQVALLLADFYGFTDKESAAAVSLSLPSFKKLLHETRCCLRAAALSACALVASGDCPLLRSAELADAEPNRAEVPHVSAGAGASGPPRPNFEQAETASLLALRRELLEGLGVENPPSGFGGRTT